MTFEDRVKKWEGKIEDILVEMASEKTGGGFYLEPFDHTAITKSFNEAINHIRRSMNSNAVYIRPGNRRQED